MCDAHLAKMAAMYGLAYSDLLKSILRAAEERLGHDPAKGAIKAQA